MDVTQGHFHAVLLKKWSQIIWKHQLQHVYFYLQNQSYHVQMLGIVGREHRQPTCFVVLNHEGKPWGAAP